MTLGQISSLFVHFLIPGVWIMTACWSDIVTNAQEMLDSPHWRYKMLDDGSCSQSFGEEGFHIKAVTSWLYFKALPTQELNLSPRLIVVRDQVIATEQQSSL